MNTRPIYWRQWRGTNMPTVAGLLARHRVLEAVSDSAMLDTELLLAHCLGKDRSYLRAWPEAEVPDPLASRFGDLFARRQRGEPVAYLTGTRGFWSFDLKVSPVTLIPRPETELLIEKVLDIFPRDTPANFLDLGTGTGAVALALATEFAGSRVLGCDIEPAAVALAEYNRQTLGLVNVRFIESDWFDNMPDQGFDCIVSNPPYIDPQDPHLQRGDVRFEPASALVAQNGGLQAIEKILACVAGYLNQQGWLLLEHGFDQGVAVRGLLLSHGFDCVETFKDLAGLDRVTVGRLESL